MKERAFNAYQHEVCAILDGRQTQFRRVIKPQPIGEYKGGFIGVLPRCRYGDLGDLLWVREAWAYENAQGYSGDVLLFRADGDISGVPWRRSIHMPRWASRITLRIVDVRIERVQEIGPSDYRAEGIDLSYGAQMNSLQIEPMYKNRWIALWDSINAKRGYGWDANPLVWVIEFEKVQL